MMHSPQFFHRAQDSNARAHPRSRWLRQLFAAVARTGSAIQAQLRARRAAAELARLDDRMLRDIGVSRSEIRSLLRRPTARTQVSRLGWRRRNQQDGSD